ncbi:MAG TPA: YkgJ family cysteine cluster protein [Sedimenticola sp.]|nr:YkgJ family cysteine cluster protein [Sedimenticola sp.]
MPEQREPFNIELKIGGRRLRLEGAVPAGPLSMADLLPLIQRLADAVGEVAAQEVEARGKKIACRAGCGACCRQLVPVSEPEALYLSQRVDAMPAERRDRIRGRFARGLEELDRRGMLEALRGAAGVRDREARRAFGEAYFRLGIPCPFLEDESCGIHPHRPISCREYLVTSSPADCADPVGRRVETVTLPRRVSSILYRFGDGAGGDSARWLPMILALAWAQEHRDSPLPTCPGPELFENFIRRLASG